MISRNKANIIPCYWIWYEKGSVIEFSLECICVESSGIRFLVLNRKLNVVCGIAI